jgi:hypothetical protein
MVMMRIRLVLLALLAICSLTGAVSAAAQTSDSKSLDEVNKELSNPISSIWALQLQENTYWLNRPERNVVNLQFQPVPPLALTDNWNLITRPVFQMMNSTPYVNQSGNMLTFPIGLNVSKVIKIGPLPVKFQVQGQYMPVHPDVFGQKWNLQFAVTPVIPKLIKENIFGN